MPMTARSADDLLSAGKRHAHLVAVVGDGGDAVAAAGFHALGDMRLMDDFGDLGRHAAHQDARLRLDDGDRRAQFAGRGGELEADEAAADDGDTVAGAEMRANGERVVEGSEIDAARAEPRHRQLARRSSRWPAAACRKAGSEPSDRRTNMRCAVDRHGLNGVDMPDRSLGQHLVAGDRLDLRRVADHRVFGQRRALIGQMRLVADQRHRAVKAEIAQRQCCSPAAFAGADDDHSCPHGHHPIWSRTLPASTLTG